MYQKERLENIMNIMKKYNYVTVKFLVEELHYSTATINRDLNVLANQKLIKSYLKQLKCLIIANQLPQTLSQAILKRLELLNKIWQKPE